MAEDHQEPTTNGAEGNAADVPNANPEAINLTFRDQRGQEVVFKLKTTTKLGKAMDAFNKKMNRKPKELRFHFEGTRVLDDHTPADLDMEDGCLIDAFEEQLGGAGASAVLG